MNRNERKNSSRDHRGAEFVNTARQQLGAGPSPADREWGLDVLRALAMMGIVGLHVYNQGGALNATAGNLPKMIAARTISAACYCSVNVFGMLTGWLYIGRENVKMRGLARLLLAALGWSLVITAVFLIAKPELFSANKGLLLEAIYPALADKSWYLTCYAFCFLMIPYMNAMVRSLKPEQFRRLVMILFGLLSVVTTAFRHDYFMVSKGYSPIWLMFCYLLGGYMRLNREKFDRIRPLPAVIVLGLIVALVSAADLIGIRLRIDLLRSLFNYNSPFTVVNAVLLLALFSRIDVRGMRTRKLLLFLSSKTFNVYLIHTHVLVYNYLLDDLFVWTGRGGMLRCVCGPLLGIVGVYVACMAVSWLCKLAGDVCVRLLPRRG